MCPRTLAATALAGITLFACTPREHAAWLVWHDRDPAAAEAFADEWLRDHLAEDDQQERTGSSSDASNASDAGGDVWDQLAWCESGGNWSYNGGSGYDGGLQFLPATWRAYGGQEFAEYAYQASRGEQIAVAQRVQDDVGWGAWPACSRELGLR